MAIDLIIDINKANELQFKAVFNEYPPANTAGIVLVQTKIAPNLHTLDVLYNNDFIPKHNKNRP